MKSAATRTGIALTRRNDAARIRLFIGGTLVSFTFGHRRLIFALAAFAGVVATGCSGPYNANSGYNSAGLPCGAPTGKYALVYPAPGATAIPDSLAEVVFGSTNGLSLNYQAVLQPSGYGQNIVFGQVATAPLPLPTPNLVPSFANPIYQDSPNSAGVVLPAATLISVYLNDGSSNCTPTLAGTFTTQ